MTLRVIGSYLYSDWFASGEIPLRAVHEGLIDRFGSIDNSQGGTTQRFNFNSNLLWKPSENEVVSLQGYASYYFLNLFSNFTFFLVDPENGDGIQQYDRRWYGGFDGRYERQDRPFGVNTTSTAGFQYRIDAPHVVLAAQADRHRLPPPPPDSPFQAENVNILEQSYSPFVKFALAPVGHAVAALRHRRPRRHLHLQRAGPARGGNSQRIRGPGDSQREGQPRPRALVPRPSSSPTSGPDSTATTRAP